MVYRFRSSHRIFVSLFFSTLGFGFALSAQDFVWEKEDAETSIEELYAWPFDGPELRDLAGREPSGGGRNIGI